METRSFHRISVVLPWCMVFPSCLNGASMVSIWCFHMVSHGPFRTLGAPVGLQWCFHGASIVLPCDVHESMVLSKDLHGACMMLQ